MVRSTLTLLAMAALAAILLHVDFGTAHPAPPDGRHVFSIVDDLESYSINSSRTKFLLTAAQSGGRFSIVDETFYPGMDSRPGHTHTYHSEVFYVMTGEMEWTVGGEVQLLGPGDLVYIPPGTLHATRVMGDEPVHALMIFEPGGYEHGYFARSALTDEDRQNPDKMKDLRTIMDVVPAPRPNQ
jgi:quercetin dioxygenase-like cupin family protein